ncbi:MAG TPA: hypothetical protein VM307_15630 [Egibacteraceae bacterium]|nr:hypothetical protein [Egibacteraceae bacterium]
MTLWRMEIARLLRTRRIVALGFVYLFFGFVGPLTARYMEQIIARFGGGMAVDVPPPTPADGILQFASNAQQIGLLVVLVVAAGALAFDARPEIGLFLRTRVRSVARLLAPRYVVTTVAAGVAFVLGTLAAWYETAVLIGPLPAGRMIAGMAYGVLYLAFAVAVVALATAVMRGRLAAVAVAIIALLTLPILGLLPAVEPWLPSRLVGAQVALAAGDAPADYVRAAIVSVLASAALLAVSTVLLRRRET